MWLFGKNFELDEPTINHLKIICNLSQNLYTSSCVIYSFVFCCMKKKFLLFIMLLIIVFIILLVIVNRKDEIAKIDLTKTDFKYDVKVCDEYFELVECIIERDTDDSFTTQMRIDLKNEIKSIQEKWKQLNEDVLSKKCSDALEEYKDLLRKNNVETFGCLIGK